MIPSSHLPTWLVFPFLNQESIVHIYFFLFLFLKWFLSSLLKDVLFILMSWWRDNNKRECRSECRSEFRCLLCVSFPYLLAFSVINSREVIVSPSHFKPIERRKASLDLIPQRFLLYLVFLDSGSERDSNLAFLSCSLMRCVCATNSTWLWTAWLSQFESELVVKLVSIHS